MHVSIVSRKELTEKERFLCYDTLRMEMRLVRWLLVLGGVFNSVMGLVFFSDQLLRQFLVIATGLEAILFSRVASIPFPEDQTHRMLIHGFGAAAMILGATLICSSRNPARWTPFILVDGVGRLLFGGLMVSSVFAFSLMRIILSFAVLELFFAFSYLAIAWKLRDAGSEYG